MKEILVVFLVLFFLSFLAFGNPFAPGGLPTNRARLRRRETFTATMIRKMSGLPRDSVKIARSFLNQFSKPLHAPASHFLLGASVPALDVPRGAMAYARVRATHASLSIPPPLPPPKV